MSSKSIWYISQYASPVKYGFGTRHFPLAREWAKKGHKVTILSATYNYLNHTSPPCKKFFNFEEIDNFLCCWIKVNKYKGGHSIGRILSWFIFTIALLFYPHKKYGKPDVVIISSMSFVPIISGYIFKLRFNAKLIFEIRDIWPQTIIDLGGFSPKNIFVRFASAVEKFGYTVSDAIVGTMPALDKHVEKVIDCKFKFACIPQGLDLEFTKTFETLDQRIQDEHFPKDKFIVGYAGALVVSNALETLIKCARIMSKKEPRIHFLLIGNGNHRRKLYKLAEGLDNITFIPKIQKNQVNSFLTKCDLLYDSISNVSIYNYGLSKNKWIDYMYSGRPMVVSHSGFLSMINDADSGTAVPADDENALTQEIVKYFQKTESELSTMGERGKTYLLNNHTFDILADRYAELF